MSPPAEPEPDDPDVMYRAVAARDRRFDGRFVLAVATTGIYCRPSCPARTPLQANIRYYRVAAAAVAAGYRACKRCRPEAVPGGRDWDHRADLASRALRAIADGVVDEHGVAGLARQLSVSERHLHRTLLVEFGVSASALAQTRRAQTARLLLEQTPLRVTDVAYAAGFSSIRQFNDVMRVEFGEPPSSLRARGSRADRPAKSGPLTVRLATRTPWDVDGTMDFLAKRAIHGIECVSGDVFARSLRTPYGDAVVELRADSDRRGNDRRLITRLHLGDLASLPQAVSSCRRLFDLDADPEAVDKCLQADPVLAPLVEHRPGVRVAGTVDGFELAVRAVVGQQVSVAGARTMLSRIVAACGGPLSLGDQQPVAGVSRVFPSAAQLVDADLTGVGLTGRRTATIRAIASGVVSGQLHLAPDADLSEQRQRLLAIEGVGDWTAEYIAMRALADADAFVATDLVVKREVTGQGAAPNRWRPWRAYAVMHLWSGPHSSTATTRRKGASS